MSWCYLVVLDGSQQWVKNTQMLPHSQIALWDPFYYSSFYLLFFPTLLELNTLFPKDSLPSLQISGLWQELPPSSLLTIITDLSTLSIMSCNTDHIIQMHWLCDKSQSTRFKQSQGLKQPFIESHLDWVNWLLQCNLHGAAFED